MSELSPVGSSVGTSVALLMASCPLSFVNMDMVLRAWIHTKEQEQVFLANAAKHLDGESAATLERIVAVELPDVPEVRFYQEMYKLVSRTRDDLVHPCPPRHHLWGAVAR